MRAVTGKNEFRSRIMKFNARAILSIFYECYRNGVSDAADLCDENRCKKYVERMKATHVFSLVNQDYDMSWQEWRIRMVAYTSQVTPWRERLRRFLIDIDRYGAYYSVALRIGMDFYVLGVEDFAKYPVHKGLELFLAEKHYRKWKKGFEHDIYRTYQRVFDDLQVVVFDRARYDLTVAQKSADGYNMAMTERTYMNFLEAMYLCIYKKMKSEWWNAGEDDK